MAATARTPHHCHRPARPTDVIAVADALALVLAGVHPVATEIVSLAAAHGRVLAADVCARRTQPPRAVSAMDGYAVRAADVASPPATLRVIGAAAAGAAFGGRIGAGEAVRIFTGAAVPDGADAIVIQEHATADASRVVVGTPAAPGRFIRAAGLDFAAGEALLAAGRRLTARDVALAAAMNVPWLGVRRRPRIAHLATGDELVRPGEPLAADTIVSCNGALLAACIGAFGGEAIDLGIAPDDPAALRAAAAAAHGCDLLVTTGGASVGDHDLVRPALETLGFSVRFHGVAMRPGKPILFGHLGALPVLGLPGNPVSAGVGALVFLRPALAAMLGRDDRPPPGAASALLACDLPANDAREDYLRARLDVDAGGHLVATPFGRQDSAMLRLFGQADALVVRKPFAAAAAAGTPVPILAFDAGV